MTNFLIYFKASPFLIYLFLLAEISNAQNNHFFSLNNNDDLKIIKNELNTYDYFFIGERHETFEISKTKLLFFDKILNVSNLFVEESFSYSNDYYLVFNMLNEDTTSPIFTNLASEREYLYFIKSLYTDKNKVHKNGINVRPIDVISINDINYNYIQNFYSGLKKNRIIKKDLKLLKRNKNAFDEQLKLEIFLNFYDSLQVHSMIHKSCLGEQKFNELSRGLLSLKIFYNMSVNRPQEQFQSIEREQFMCQNIVNEIKKNDSLKFVSFNGHFHITLNKPKEWVGIKNWESLAYKIKVEYPQKKVCSIYLMNRNDDPLSDEYFPTEKKLILENTKPGETYLIRLDGDNSPFKELSEKFQYIVVW